MYNYGDSLLEYNIRIDIQRNEANSPGGQAA